MRIKINKPLRGYKAGDIVEVKQTDAYWRARIEDAKIDNCLEIVVKPQAGTPSGKKENKK